MLVTEETVFTEVVAGKENKFEQTKEDSIFNLLVLEDSHATTENGLLGFGVCRVVVLTCYFMFLQVYFSLMFQVFQIRWTLWREYKRNGAA